MSLGVGMLVAVLAGSGAAQGALVQYCGTTTGLPFRATPESTWSALQSALAALPNGASQTFYLSQSITAPSGASVSPPANTGVTIDLDGCDLTVTSPATGAAAISVPSDTSLTIEDTSGAQPGDTGTLSATGGTNADFAGGAPAIDGSITIDGGAVTATGGAGGPFGGGGGAAIGGAGGGVGAAGAAFGGSVVIDGGTITLTGGSGNDGSGGGAAIGGGGSGFTGTGGGSFTGTVTIDGGTVAATGATGIASGGGGAAIGGGGSASGGNSTGGDGGSVSLGGGTLSASASSGGSGIGGGAGGGLGSAGSGGSVTVTGGSGGSGVPALTGEVAGSLTVDANSQLSVPAGGSLALDGSGSNQGTIDLAGALTGAGSLTNHGSIAVSGTGWSADDHGPAAVAGARITGNAFDLSFHVPPEVTGPPDMWVFAPTLGSSGETLPTLRTKTGSQTVGWKSRATLVGASTPLGALAMAGRITLIGNPAAITARLSSRRPKTRFGWWGSPVTIRFRCASPSGGRLVGTCPKAVRLSRSARGQRVTRKVTASNGATATVTANAINIDLHKPNVRITGPRAGNTYLGGAPKARCRASERPSGIASCRLEVHRRGARETITARATTRAGVSRTVKVTFNI